MNSLKQLLVLSIAVLYLFLSTGVLLFRTHCECSGKTSISVYVNTESNCDSDYEDSCCSDNKTCETNESAEFNYCECNSPLVTYLKLTDHSGENYKFEYPIAKQLSLTHFFASEPTKVIILSTEPRVYPQYTPPQKPLYGRLLLNFLNQRKIALLA